MNIQFKPAQAKDTSIIWKILQQAIARRKKDGSNQWQDGYPNLEVVKNDIEKGVGYVLTLNHEVIGYAAVLFNDEPAYEAIEGKWLTNNDFVVVHRVAIADEHMGKGLSKTIFKEIETIALNNKINSIKVDTNFDNAPMLKILDQLDYTYCGEVYFRGSARKAFEKVLR